MKTNKLPYIISLVLCAAGAGLYTYAYITKAELDSEIENFKTETGKLQDALTANQGQIITQKLENYTGLCENR